MDPPFTYVLHLMHQARLSARDQGVDLSCFVRTAGGTDPAADALCTQ
jgi:hypothetical protein